MKLKSILCLLAAAFCVSAFAQPSLALIVNAETPGRTGDHDVDVSAYTADQYITVDLVLRDLGTGAFRLAGWEGSINWGTFVFNSPLENVGAANAPFELVTGAGGLPTSQILPADDAGQPTTSTGSNILGTFRGGAVILNNDERPNTGTLVLGRWRLYPARFHDINGGDRDIVSCVSNVEYIRFVANDISADRHIIAKEDATAASSSEVTFADADLEVRLNNASVTRRKLDLTGEGNISSSDLLRFITCLFQDCSTLLPDVDERLQVMDANCDGRIATSDLLPALRRYSGNLTRKNKNTVVYDLAEGEGTLVFQPAPVAGSLFMTSLVPRGGSFGDVSLPQSAIDKGWNIHAMDMVGSDQLNIVLYNLNGDQEVPEIHVGYQAGASMSYYMGSVETLDQNEKFVRFDTSKVSFQTIQK